MKRLIKDIKYWLDLRVKKLKLSVIEHTSRVISNVIAYFAIMLLVGIAVILFSGALTVLVYQWVGSLLCAFLIMGCFMLLVAMIFYLLRNRLFTGIMVGSFSRMLFKEKYDYEEEDDYEDY